ncbi:flagellar hook-associated protein FlgK [Sphingomonas lenta]|uniref:Flagellar hook-associated protein 1 n=1 Tax=Sphingomonas lenta TaxID=1141887 RepID=A0A2A2SG24_9SPHN|nr:flagellar hook-associated protein FlgK [Sphingomonas lenta]PAX07961.1 flagellar hook-associated protein FlgK [Sphingomonas lenta]
MSDLLSIGASGVRAYQNALTTTSENIANSGVQGYSRRRTELQEIAVPPSGYSPTKLTRGMGVAVTGIARVADAYTAAAARAAGSDLSRTEAGIEWLGRIEDALTGAGLPARVTGFFNSARQLAADPSSIAARAVMLEQAAAVAGSFRATGAALDKVQAQIDETARDLTDKLDGFGRALAVINEKIGRITPGSSAAAAMADERDRLLDAMSGLADVSVAIDDIGRATVRLGASNGPVFVTGAMSGDVAYSRATTGVASFAVYLAGQADAIQPNGGSLGAIVDAAGRTFDARTRVEQLAQDLADAVNDNQANGFDLTNGPGPDIFVGTTLATFNVSPTVEPENIAAAGAANRPRDASNLEALQQARASLGFEAKLADMTTINATALNQRRLVADAQAAIRDGAVAAREAVSGVDLDREAVDLIRFQQAYQASSRVIQVARETLQSILEIR